MLGYVQAAGAVVGVDDSAGDDVVEMAVLQRANRDHMTRLT
jgi:hypothetical protein